MIPVFRISGAQFLLTFLMVVIAFGTLHLVALSFPSSKLAQAWVTGLGF